MSNNKDKWSALSMKDRADLIKIYVESGITDLGEIRRNYNSFGDGGNTEPLYYDDTYIEPAVVKAFKSDEDYNRYYGEQFGRKVVKKRDEVAQNIFKGLQYTPIVGDAIDATNALVSLKEGDISKAAILAGTSLMPNIIEKPIKAVSKGIKNLRIYNRYTKDGERFRDAVNYSIDKYARRADLLNESYGGTYNKRKLNTAEDIRKTAYNQPINTDFRIPSLFPRVGGKYNSGTDEIWLNRFRPNLYKVAWNSPKRAIKILKNSAAHEGTHLALHHLGDNISISGEKYYVANPQHPLYDRVGYAFSDPNRKSTTWARNPEELIANMTKLGYHYNIDPTLNVRNWKAEHKKELSKYLSKNHSFTPEDALFLAEELSDFGYKNGGRLNKLDGTEREQTLSGLPINVTMLTPYEASIVTPYRSVVTPEMNTEFIQDSDNKFDTFVERMYPIVEQSLARKGYSQNNINNILKQMAQESNYGLSPRGNGYNLSGIKAWNDNEGTKHSDGEIYRDFKDYSDYVDYYVDLLNNRYDALNAKDVDDYIYRLHHTKDGRKYSADEEGYKKNLKNMISLDRAINKYLNK